MATYVETLERFAAERFPDDSRAVLACLLRHAYGWGGATLAHELGIPQATAQRLIARGRKIVAEAVSSGELSRDEVQALLASARA